LGAVFAALYISQRQELLRKKENKQLGLITLMRHRASLDRIHLQCDITKMRVNNIKPFIDPQTKKKSYQSSSEVDFHNSLIDDEEINISAEDLVRISYIDFGLALEITAALENIDRFNAYCSNFQKVYPVVDQKTFDRFVQNIKASADISVHHMERANSIRANILNEKLLKYDPKLFVK